MFSSICIIELSPSYMEINRLNSRTSSNQSPCCATKTRFNSGVPLGNSVEGHKRARSITMGIIRSTRVLIPSAISYPSFTEKQLAGGPTWYARRRVTSKGCQAFLSRLWDSGLKPLRLQVVLRGISELQIAIASNRMFRCRCTIDLRWK
jgi:hypothetical protein